MSVHFVFQIPYHEEKSRFLLQVLQTAAKAHCQFQERATLAADLQAVPNTESAPYIITKETTGDHRSMPVSNSLSWRRDSS